MENIENLNLDLTEETPVIQEITKDNKQSKKSTQKETTAMTNKEEPVLINCLRNESVTVRFIKRDTGFISNPKHVLYGGMADTSCRYFTIPLLDSGVIKNVLTNSEKDFLEQAMGLPENALSVYLKNDNFWSNYFIRLTKQDTILNLSVPEDFIKYKVLLANEDAIAKNLEHMSKYPKATYQYVLISENDEMKTGKDAMTLGMEANIAFSKLSDNKDALKVIIEIMEGKPVSGQSKIDFLKTQAYRLMSANPRLFLSITNDSYFETKVLIRCCTEYGFIRKRGDYYYLAETNAPLSEPNDEPVLANVVKYINHPLRQETKLMLEAKLKTIK